MKVSRAAVLAAGLVASLAPPAAAQTLDGVWFAELRQQNGVGRYQLTISQGQYALTSSLTTPEGYYYETYQAGAADFHPPDTLRLVVLDWQPREYLGNVMAMPPNSNLRVLAFDGRTLTLMDNVCAMSAPAETCSTTYRRMQ